MLNGSFNILSLPAIVVIVVFLARRFLKRKKLRDCFESFQASNNTKSARIFERQRVPATKKCPGCEQQLPLSAIMCEGCDYNFLAARPDRLHSMLPAPEALAEEPEQKKIAAAI